MLKFSRFSFSESHANQLSLSENEFSTVTPKWWSGDGAVSLANPDKIR